MPKAIEPGRLAELTDKLCAGDRSVVDEIACGHLRLVLRIASRYRRRSAYDDLVSAGIERMLECIPRFPEARKAHKGQDRGITGFIIVNVRSGISTYIEKDAVVTVPRKTLTDHGKKRPDFRVVSDEFTVEGDQGECYTDVLDAVDLCCESQLDRDIVKLRLQGLSDQAIAEQTGWSTKTVFFARTELEKRFNEVWRK